MQHFGEEVEEPGRTLPSEGEGVLLVGNAFELQTEQASVGKTGDNVAERIAEITFPQETPRVSGDKLDQGEQRFVLQRDKVWLNAVIDGWELAGGGAAWMRQVVNSAQLGGVRLWFGAHRGADEERGVGDDGKTALGKALLSLLADVSSASAIER